MVASVSLSQIYRVFQIESILLAGFSSPQVVFRIKQKAVALTILQVEITVKPQISNVPNYPPEPSIYTSKVMI